MPILALLIAAACGSEQAPPPTPAPDLEAAYLDGLTDLRDEIDQTSRRFDELLGPIFPRFAPDEIQARVLFNALEEQSISDSTAEWVRMIEALDPPERFAADHATFVASLRKQMTSAAAVDDAVGRRDLPHVHLEMAEIQAMDLVSLIGVSADFAGTLLQRPCLGPAGPRPTSTSVRSSVATSRYPVGNTAPPSSG